MKSKVKLSTFSKALTITLIIILLIGCAVSIHEKAAFLIVLIIPLFLLISTALYAPVSISADKETVCIHTLLKKHRLPMEGIESVERFSPTMGAIRICASGGFMGYWGIFREGDIGRYYGYYGKASDFFLIRMKSGEQYVLGCENPAAMTSYISSRLRA